MIAVASIVALCVAFLVAAKLVLRRFDGSYEPGHVRRAREEDMFAGWAMPPEIAHEEYPTPPAAADPAGVSAAAGSTTSLAPFPPETRAPGRDEGTPATAAAAAPPGIPPPEPPPLPPGTLDGLAAVAAIRDQLGAPDSDPRWPWLDEGQYAEQTGAFAAICEVE